jgi:hypothetical protein
VNSATQADYIEGFLKAIGARLGGPATARADILAELRDGLLQAAEANQRAGLAPGDAVQLALQQFDDAPTFAASFWLELAALRARRVVMTLFASAPIVAALWISAARSRSPRSARLFDSAPAHVSAVLQVTAAIGCGIWTLAATGRATRWLPTAPRTPLLAAAATAGITAVSDLLLLTLLATRLAGYQGPIHQLALGAAILASATRFVVTSRASRSCLRACFARTGT